MLSNAKLHFIIYFFATRLTLKAEVEHICFFAPGDPGAGADPNQLFFLKKRPPNPGKASGTFTSKQTKGFDAHRNFLGGARGPFWNPRQP